MNQKLLQAGSFDEARRLLDVYGDFHDATIESLLQDYSAKRVDVHLDNMFCGLQDHMRQPGTLRFEGIERVICQIPYIGGEVRVEGVELGKTDTGFCWEFELTTTEWMDNEEFRTIRLVTDATRVCIRPTAGA